MSESERYVPPEARPEAEPEKSEKPKLSPETIHNIRHGPAETVSKPETSSQPEATGERIHWRMPDGNLITPEKEEIYRPPETLPEKEPGYGPKPSFSDDPTNTGGDSSHATAMDDQTTTDIEENEQNDVPQRQQTLDAVTKQSIMGWIQALDQDIAQAEEVKSIKLNEAAQAMKAGDLDKADRATTVAGEADSAVSHMRKEQLDLQRQLETAEEAANQPETPAEPSEAAGVPPPDKRKMTRPSDVEAKEGDRNVEDDMQERNPEHRPLDKEGRLTGRKR